MLLQATGTDFSAYKTTTLERRIARRMAVSRIETLEEYAHHLEGDEAETEALYEDCLISVTSFFRDPAVFQALERAGLSRLLRRPARRRPPAHLGARLRDRRRGLLDRHVPPGGGRQKPRNPTFQIFATDLSESALKKARAGLYLENIAQHVSPERLRRFFTRWAATTRSARPSARCACSPATT